MDRFIGGLVALLVLVCLWMGIAGESGMLILWAIVLGAWAASGLKHIPVGWRGQILSFGERTQKVLGEGWRWAPFPLGLQSANCKRRTSDLGVMEATTSDNVKVFIGGSVVFQITDLDTYFGVEGEELERWLDKTRQELVRAEVRRRPQEEVLGMHEGLGDMLEEALRDRGSEHWGITVFEVILPEISPDPKTGEDLALKRREELQRVGQEEELAHFARQVRALMAAPPAGPGLTREQAVEQVQIALGQLKKEARTQAFALDPATAAMVAEILRRR